MFELDRAKNRPGKKGQKIVRFTKKATKGQLNSE